VVNVEVRAVIKEREVLKAAAEATFTEARGFVEAQNQWLV